MAAALSPAPGPSRTDARALLRGWTAADEPQVLWTVDALGAGAVRAAAAASARLDRHQARGGADAALAIIEQLAADLSAPPPAARRGLFARAPAPAPDPQPRIAGLVGDIDRELEVVVRSAILLEGDRAKLTDAAAALDESLDLVRDCTKAVAAAARELAPDRPDRARFFAEAVGPRLIEREQDLLAQAAVTRQAILTLGMVADGQDALRRALVRARDLSVAALRTAVAARRTVENGAALSALERTLHAGEAREGDPPLSLSEAARAARREIEAAEAAWSLGG